MFDTLDAQGMLDQLSDRRKQDAQQIARMWGHTTGGLSVLDFGCGDGRLALEVSNLLTDKCRFHMVDANPEMVSAATALMASTGNAAEAHFWPPRIRLNRVLASHVLYYIPDTEKFCETALDSLDDGGALTVVQRSDSCDTYALRETTRAISKPRNNSASRVANWSSNHGLEIISCQARATLEISPEVPLNDPEMLSRDDPFGRLVRFLCRISDPTHLSHTSRASVRSFLATRQTPEGKVRLSMVDEILTVYRDSPSE